MKIDHVSPAREVEEEEVRKLLGGQTIGLAVDPRFLRLSTCLTFSVQDSLRLRREGSTSGTGASST